MSKNETTMRKLSIIAAFMLAVIFTLTTIIAVAADNENNSGEMIALNEDVNAASATNNTVDEINASDNSILYGDVNNDGTVNNEDAEHLARYLANWSVDIDEVASDCNLDGEVDLRDNILLAQYLAGWFTELPQEAGSTPSIPGDVNSDGYVDDNDATLLGQYLAKWDVTINETTADCYRDGNIDVKDAVLLAQYLDGWSVDFPMTVVDNETTDANTN